MSSPPGTSLRVPTLPWPRLQPATRPRGPGRARLQPVVELDAAGRRPLLAARSGGLGPPPQPDRGAGQHACWALGGGGGRRGLPGRRQPPAGRVPPLHGQRQRLLVPAAGGGRPRTARCPGPSAYFCAEYGFHESMQIYSGGLGILAGDHCKSASDAAIPFVGVGLLYRRGYFRQQIDADGHQEHAQPDLDPCDAAAPPGARPPTDRRCRSASTSPTARCMPRCGWRRSAASRSCCWTPTCPPTTGPDRPDHPHPVRARSRDAPLPGADPGRGRRAGAGRAGHRRRRSGT